MKNKAKQKLKPAIWQSFIKPPAWLAKLFFLSFLIILIGLVYLGYLKPIVAILDSDQFAFKIGDTRLSVFQVLKGLITISMGFWLAGWFADYTENRIKALKKIRAHSKAILIKFLQIVIYLILFLICLDIIGVDLTTLSILGGAVGIGIGFGLQKITSNFISGLILLFENSMEINDLVELSDGLSGFIRKTNARYTLMETFDGKEVMIPNEDFVTSRVINWTYTNNNGRIEIVIGVSYDCDIELANKLILEAANEHPSCMKTPEAVCYIDDFADSSVNFLLHFWVEDITAGRRGPRSDVMRTIWHKFKDHGIVIPYPQRDVHMIQEGDFK